MGTAKMNQGHLVTLTFQHETEQVLLSEALMCCLKQLKKNTRFKKI